MKKLLFAITAVLAAVLVLFVFVRERPTDDSQESSVAEDAARKRVKEFWAAFNRAGTLRLAGNYAAAASAYRECLKSDPRHEDSLYYLGTSLEEMGDYNGAVATLRELIRVNPSSGRAYAELGNALSSLSPGAPADFDAAREAYRRNIQINGEQAGPFIRLGLVDLNQGRREKALENFRIAAGFGAPEGNYFAGAALFLEGRYREAMPAFRKVLDVYARDKKITGKGVLSEGDVLPAAGKSMSALERAAVKSILLLHWAAMRAGGYPPGVANEFRFEKRAASDAAALADVSKRSWRNPAARICTIDTRGDGRLDRVEVGAARDGRSAVRLFRNTGGRLVEATREANLNSDGTAVDCAVADYDGDGRADLLVYFWKRGLRLYRNLGDGAFEGVTGRAGLGGVAGEGFSALFFDFDGDGRPDIFVSAHAAFEDVARCLLDPAFKVARGTPHLFRNRGDGTFEDVSAAAGLTRSYGTMQAVAADVNHDGRPDLVLANGALEAERLEPSVVLLNMDGKKFREVYLPGFETPGNFVGVKTATSPNGAMQIYLGVSPAQPSAR